MQPVALITGAAVRIGHAIALRLAAEGFAVAIHYNRSRQQAVDLAHRICEAGGHAAAFQADLANTDRLHALVESAAQALGPVSCLVNNASLFADDTAASFTPSQWDAHFAINLRAPVVLSQALAAQLPGGVQGSIINIIDQRVLKPNPLFFTYTLSKCALWSATVTLAQSFAPRIRVNAIGPGPVLRSIHQRDGEFEREQASTLLQKGVSPEEIADTAVFLIRAPSITGQMLAVDSGQHLLWPLAEQ